MKNMISIACYHSAVLLMVFFAAACDVGENPALTPTLSAVGPVASATPWVIRVVPSPQVVLVTVTPVPPLPSPARVASIQPEVSPQVAAPSTATPVQDSGFAATIAAIVATPTTQVAVEGWTEVPPSTPESTATAIATPVVNLPAPPIAPSPTPTAMPSASPTVGVTCPPCCIKGNISSTGAKIYHVPGGQFYGRTIIGDRPGDRWFCSEEDARAAGWRKSQR